MANLPRNDSSSSPDPDNQEGREGSGPRAELAPPAPPAIRQPVDLNEVDQGEAVAIMRPAIDTAASIVGDVDAFPLQQICAVLIRHIQSGAAADGVSVSEVCAAARVGRGRLAEHYTPSWAIAFELAVRLIAVSAERRVLYEEIFAVPAPTRRGHHGLGTHHHEQAAHGMHFAGTALGTADRHCACWDVPLLTGTRDDRTLPGTDIDRIKRFGEELGRPVPGSLAEHVADLLRFQVEVRSRVRDAGDRIGDALQELKLTPAAFASRGFSQNLLLHAMPFGPPTSRRGRSGQVAIPGRDPAVVDVLERMRWPAVVFAGTEGAPGGDLAKRGYTQVSWDVGDIGLVLGVPTVAPWGVTMMWSPAESILLRVNAGEGAWVDAWRLVNIGEDALPLAIALAARSLESWPRECLERAIVAGAPGLLKSTNLASQSAWRGLLRVADAALVAAERQMRAEGERG